MRPGGEARGRERRRGDAGGYEGAVHVDVVAGGAGDRVPAESRRRPVDRGGRERGRGRRGARTRRREPSHRRIARDRRAVGIALGPDLPVVGLAGLEAPDLHRLGSDVAAQDLPGGKLGVHQEVVPERRDRFRPGQVDDAGGREGAVGGRDRVEALHAVAACSDRTHAVGLRVRQQDVASGVHAQAGGAERRGGRGAVVAREAGEAVPGDGADEAGREIEPSDLRVRDVVVP